MDARNKRASHFNVMVCGASGIGKSLFCDMFMGQLNKKEYKEIVAQKLLNKEKRNVLNEATDEFVVKRNSLNEKLNISMIDSPGYGDKTDIEQWRNTIIN